MPHLDLGTYLSDDTLVLNGVVTDKYPDGKSYTIESPTAIDGLRLQRFMAAGGTGPAALADRAAFEDLVEFCKDADGKQIGIDEKILGPATHAEMLADGVSSERLTRIVRVVMTHYGLGAEVASRVVAAAGEAAAPTTGAATPARSTSGKPRTRKATAGSASTSSRSGTPAPAPARTSTRSSSKPPTKSAAKPAAEAQAS